MLNKRKYIDKPCCQKRKYIDETVLDFFNGDEDKLQEWLITPNPMMGGISPMKTSISKLYDIVKEAMASNETASGGSCLGCQ